ncbi:HTH_Tnp_Tc3_2 domain-containing protein [Trichonephila clavipes]|nr:HTH_Tnp_Tc3_2 domain-containing protein [Trichonephila clavipes]
MRNLYSWFLIHLLHLNVVAWSNVFVLPRVKARNAFQHTYDFAKGRVMVYRDYNLSYRSIASRVGRDPITVSRIWNGWFQDRNMERRAVSQRLRIPSSQGDKHVTRIILMDRVATSRALSQELGSFERQQLSVRTV